jgi:hypothetical protein
LHNHGGWRCKQQQCARVLVAATTSSAPGFAIHDNNAGYFSSQPLAKFRQDLEMPSKLDQTINRVINFLKKSNFKNHEKKIDLFGKKNFISHKINS